MVWGFTNDEVFPVVLPHAEFISSFIKESLVLRPQSWGECSPDNRRTNWATLVCLRTAWSCPHVLGLTGPRGGQSWAVVWVPCTAVGWWPCPVLLSHLVSRKLSTFEYVMQEREKEQWEMAGEKQEQLVHMEEGAKQVPLSLPFKSVQGWGPHGHPPLLPSWYGPATLWCVWTCLRVRLRVCLYGACGVWGYMCGYMNAVCAHGEHRTLLSGLGTTKCSPSHHFWHCTNRPASTTEQEKWRHTEYKLKLCLFAGDSILKN